MKALAIATHGGDKVVVIDGVVIFVGDCRFVFDHLARHRHSRPSTPTTTAETTQCGFGLRQFSKSGLRAASPTLPWRFLSASKHSECALLCRRFRQMAVSCIVAAFCSHCPQSMFCFASLDTFWSFHNPCRRIISNCVHTHSSTHHTHTHFSVRDGPHSTRTHIHGRKHHFMTMNVACGRARVQASGTLTSHDVDLKKLCASRERPGGEGWKAFFKWAKSGNVSISMAFFLLRGQIHARDSNVVVCPVCFKSRFKTM